MVSVFQDLGEKQVDAIEFYSYGLVNMKYP